MALSIHARHRFRSPARQRALGPWKHRFVCLRWIFLVAVAVQNIERFR